MQTTNQFTDRSACTVLPREGKIASGMGSLLYEGRLYPYAERRGDELRVGVRSGGIALPVGRVEMRVDQNAEWIIETSETPIDSEASNSQAMTAAMAKNLTPEQAKSLAATSDITARSINQIVSPYTATTGERAHAILAQMKAGKEIIYRRMGANAAGSTTGEMPLGPDFLAALSECGL